MAQIDWDKELKDFRESRGAKEQPIQQPIQQPTSNAIDWDKELADFRKQREVPPPVQTPVTIPQVQPQPQRTPWQILITPISKQLTGKSIGERTNFLEKSASGIEKQAIKQGRTLSIPEAYLRQLPAAIAQAGVNLADLSPLDVGLMAGTAGVAKIPFKGIPIGEITTKIPINKRFFQSINEFAKYQDWLKIPKISPTSKELITKQVGNTPDFAENINLKKYPPDVRQTISDIVTEKPELGKTPTISDRELATRAANLKDTPTIKLLAELPEGTVEAEALKLRQGNVESIRQALAGELTDLKNNLDNVVEQGIGLHRRTASMFGRGLRQQRLPAEVQQKMAFQIDDTLARLKKDPILNKDKELIDTVKKLRKMVVEKEFNPTIWNQVYFAWLNSILSNPFTHLVNTASNTYFALAKIPEKFASAVWDLPLSLKTGQRTQFFGEIPAMIKGALSKNPLPQELALGSKLDVMTTPIRGGLGKVIGTPVRLLQFEDNLAKSLVGKMEYAAQKYAGKSGEELTNAVNAEQLYRTFQSDTGSLAESLMNFRSRIPSLRYVIPFIRTPANLIARGIERTPLIVAKMIHKGRVGNYTQGELAKDLGNLTLGTMGAGWIGLQWAKGNIIGSAPSDSAQRDAFYRQGKKPNAIRIGDNWIPLERLEPLGQSFSIMVNLIQDYQQSGKEIPAEKAQEAFVQLGKTLINKSYLSGFTGLVNALSDPEMYGKGFLQKIASGSVPQLLKFFADLQDPYYREANTILDQLKVKIPGVSQTLPPKLNVFGEPIKRDLFNIGKVSKDPLESMIAETPINFPGRMLGKEKMIPEEYRWLLQTSGQTLKKKLLKIDPEKFNRLPVDLKEKTIDYLRNKSVEIPRKYLRVLREQEKLKTK